MQQLSSATPIVNITTMDLGAEFADLGSSPADLRTLVQRISGLEQRNRELEALAQQLELNVKQLAALVYVDALTGLANRRCFDSALESELRRAARTHQPLALLLCDIDWFKHYNDTYGHSHGDVVLVRIADLLKTFCQREGDCAARYGGEEFVLLLPGVAPNEAVQIAERLRKSVAALSISHTASQTTAQVSISVGVTSVRGALTRQRRHLVEAADTALYRAKRAGRNRIKYLAAPGVVGDAGIEPATPAV